MPVAGLVVNLSQDQQLAREAIQTIRVKSAFTLGDPPRPGRYPVVMVSDDRNHAREQLEWLQTIPGINEVQIVSVDCSDLHSQYKRMTAELSDSPSPPAQEDSRHDA